MAFDQNSMPKELRPLNILRTVAEDPRIAPGTTSTRPIDGIYANQPRDAGSSPESAPAVYYPAAVADTGFIPVRLNNAVAGVTQWVPQQVQPQLSVVGGAATVNSTGGYVYSPPFRMSCSSDQASDEGSEELALGRKVKFLCSYGGKILPRPSDGALRYVGGQTRIISVRRDVTIHELVQKVDAYGQSLVIKYQLPEEDLDALVTVSCPDDLENLMDEYEKLVKRSSDGSAKIRLFLFLPSEIESSGVVHVGDLHDGGQQYVEAVNGITDGLSSSGTSGSIAIARKESVDSASSTQNSDMSGTDVTNGLGHSHGEVSGPITICGLLAGNCASLETSPKTACSDHSPSVPVDNSTASLGIQMVKVPEQEVDRSVPLSGLQPLVYDLQQHGVHFPTSQSYVHAYVDPQKEALNHADHAQPPSKMGFLPQVLGTVGSTFPQQYISSPQQFSPSVQMTNSPFVSMKPNSVSHLVQSQKVSLENYSPESMVAQGLVQIPSQQGFNALNVQVSGGVYGWHQAPCQEKVALGEGRLPSPQAVMVSEKLPRLNDCYMCEKALPHAHSDTMAQNQNEASPNTSPNSRSIYHSLLLDYRGRPMNVEQQPVAGTQQIGVGYVDHEGGRIQAEGMGLSQTVEGLYGMVTHGVQSPYGVFAANIPPLLQENVVQQVVVSPQHQIIQDATMNRPVITDLSPPGETRSQPVAVRGLPNIHSFPSVESYESTEPPVLGNPNLYPHSNTGSTNHLALDENSSGKPVYSGESDYATERTSPIAEKNEDAAATWPQPRNSGDVDTGIQGGNMKLSSSPSYRFGDTPDKSNYDLAFQPSGNLSKDLNLEHAISNKDSTEETKKHELQVSHTKIESPSTHENVEIQSTSTEMQRQDNFEDISTNFLDKLSPKFPVSDSIGRLQVIKDSDLEELRELGSGTFGTVYHGKWRGTDVAIKRISNRCFAGKSNEQERLRDDFWNEAIKLADLHHPNVVAFYGVVLDGPGGSVATVTEYMVNGSLRNALQKSERNLDKRKRLMIVMDIAFGMEYLHGRNIVHFDLKSDNLLVNLRDPHRPICKVGDLGLSKVKCQTLISGGVRGTLPWMAPELLNGSSSLVSEKVDAFSFGIVMWELLTGEEPYADLHYGAIIGGIVSNTLRPSVPETCEPDWRSLMERCWSSEPSERPTFIEITNELQSMAAKLPLKGHVPQLHQ